MNYKLIGNGDYKHPVQTLLQNRGVKDIQNYINLDDRCIHNYSEMGDIEHIANKVYEEWTTNKSKIHIIVDSDVDGFTSAAVMYKYLKNMGITPTYSLHTGKQHGLTEDIHIPDDIQWLIIPDARTNDTEQCKSLHKKGVKILILDHHEKEKDNPYAYIINNQICSYPNKNLSGVGIVYKFLQALDETGWNEEADDYLDLVALGNISDCMDIREPETKRLIEKGLHNIRNKFFEKLIEAQSYSIPDGLDIISVQFYITPLINALIRVGTQEEKDVVFRAFIENESKTFIYKKRGEAEPTQESIYDRAVRFCKNAKSKQRRMVDKQLPLVCEHIEKQNQNRNNVIISNVTNLLDSALTGVAAIKVAEKYGKPCMLLRKREDKEGIFGGSARVPNKSLILNFKNIVNEIGIFNMAQGHQSAFGVEILGSNVKKSISLLDDYIIKHDLIGEAVSYADFVIDYENFHIGIFNDIASLKSYYGNSIDECNVVIKNIPVTADNITIQGKSEDSWCIMICDESVKLVKFKCSDDDYILNFGKEDKSGFADILSYINVIGKLSYNYYKGIKTAQIIVDEYEVST
ncbi:MAG: DHH family phosphoesterase [Ruminococcus flavefaciens]|nr:DHH family phosphoesterase [Ruminococcus flavefaciens]MCM1060742.1 DHH family phosphoesterase [Eubacterium sp.]